jgi:hypothetical protein
MRVQRTRDETLHEKMENVNSSEFSTSCNRELLSFFLTLNLDCGLYDHVITRFALQLESNVSVLCH